MFSLTRSRWLLACILIALIVGDDAARAAVTRCPSILSYGGNNHGTGDNSAAFSATVSANTAPSQICVYFPSGTYAFGRAINFSFPSASASIVLKGDGRNVTSLFWPTNGGVQINYSSAFQSAVVKDLTLLGGSSADTGIGIFLNQTANIPNPANTAVTDVEDVTIRGSDGYAGANYWAIGVEANSVSNINLDGVTVVGSGAGNLGEGFYAVSSSSSIGVGYTLSRCIFNYLAYGVNFGNYIQGVSVSQSGFTGGSYGIIVLPGATALDQLTVVSSQFADSGAGILEEGPVPNTSISNSLFLVSSNGTGVYLLYGNYYTIHGNSFNGFSFNNTTGVIVSNTVNGTPGVITGNVFFSLGAGVNLTGSSNHVNVQSNVYFGNQNAVINSGQNNTIGGGSP